MGNESGQCARGQRRRKELLLFQLVLEPLWFFITAKVRAKESMQPQKLNGLAQIVWCEALQRLMFLVANEGLGIFA